MTLSREEVAAGFPTELKAFGELVRSLDEKAWETPSRCEGWTVGDVARHVVGDWTDVVAGRLDGLGTPEVTQRQVEERRGRSPEELAAELDQAAAVAVQIMDGIDDAAWEGPSPGDYDGTLGSGVEAIAANELLALDCEVLVPAALGGTIHAANAEQIRTRMIIEGANSPTTPAADEILHDKGIFIVPDVLANAGGVVVSYFEWVQNLQHFRWGEREVNDKLGNIMRRAYREVSDRAARDQATMRVAAYELGIERVLQAARDRGYV